VPELAEVEYSRKIWNPGLRQKILEVRLPKPGDRIFRGTSTEQMQAEIPGKIFAASESLGKQLLFRFGRSSWLGIHLGMSGDLRIEPLEYDPRKHDLLILRQKQRHLVFSDQRHFGRVLYHSGAQPPSWWTNLPPSILSLAFTKKLVKDFLRRRGGSPLKAVLLRQERFPGIGNWMADEILWRARLHPGRLSGTLADKEVAVLYRTVRRLCELAIKSMDEDWEYPKSWLFVHRWENGGKCPRCRATLERATIGGRTTCWCPREQRKKNRTTD
jgi:formamidopyrimidine-DNA glycosylase